MSQGEGKWDEWQGRKGLSNFISALRWEALFQLYQNPVMYTDVTVTVTCCPYCDSEKLTLESTGEGRYYVRCSKCEAQGPKASPQRMATNKWECRSIDNNPPTTQVSYKTWNIRKKKGQGRFKLVSQDVVEAVIKDEPPKIEYSPWLEGRKIELKKQSKIDKYFEAEYEKAADEE